MFTICILDYQKDDKSKKTKWGVFCGTPDTWDELVLTKCFTILVVVGWWGLFKVEAGAVPGK